MVIDAPGFQEVLFLKVKRLLRNIQGCIYTHICIGARYKHEHKAKGKVEEEQRYI